MGHSLLATLKDLKAFIGTVLVIFFRVQYGVVLEFLGKCGSVRISFGPKIKDLKPCTNLQNTAILMQGPVFGRYTLKTLSLYRRNYPDTPIVYVTWKGVCQSMVIEMEKQKVTVLLLDVPIDTNKNGNADFMIYSMRVGIEYIKNNINVKYLCRHRSDQRIYKWNWIPSLVALIDLIGIGEGTCNLSGRIVTTSGASGKLRIYHIGDQFQFGYLEDIELLWNVPSFNEGYAYLLKEYPEIVELQEREQQGLKAENYIGIFFYRALYGCWEFSHKASWRLFNDAIVIVDDSTIQLEWKRFAKKKFSGVYLQNFLDINPHIYEYRQDKIEGALSFMDWLYQKWEEDNGHCLNHPWYMYSKEQWIISEIKEPKKYRTSIQSLGGKLL